MSDLFEDCRSTLKDISYRDFQKNFTSVNNYLILILMCRLAAKPKLTNFDGEELIFSEAYYDVAGIQKLIFKLSEVEYLEVLETSKDKNGQIVKADFNWFRSGKKRKDNISLGSLKIEGSKLTVFCNSRERLHKIKKILARNCKGLLKHKATTYKNAMSAMKEREQKSPPEPEYEIPMEVQKQIIEEFQAEYQKDWLDSSIPALGGLTPKQACRTKKGKILLEELLNSIENSQLRQEREIDETGELPPPKLDTQQIRKELGLF
jgi:hypothetical protein